MIISAESAVLKNQPLSVRMSNGLRRIFRRGDTIVAASVKDLAQVEQQLHAMQAAIYTGLEQPGITGDRDDQVDAHSWVYRKIEARFGGEEAPAGQGQWVERSAGNKRIQKQVATNCLINGTWENMFSLPLKFALGTEVGLQIEAKDPAVKDFLAAWMAQGGNPIANAWVWAYRMLQWGEGAAPAIIDDQGMTKFQGWAPTAIDAVSFWMDDDMQPDLLKLANSNPYDEGIHRLKAAKSAWAKGGPEFHVERPHVAPGDIRAKRQGIWRAIEQRERWRSTRGGYDMSLLNRPGLLDGNALYYRFSQELDSRGVPWHCQGAELGRRFPLLLYGMLLHFEDMRQYLVEFNGPWSQEDAAKMTERRLRYHKGQAVFTGKDSSMKIHTPSIQGGDLEQFAEIFRNEQMQTTGARPIVSGEMPAAFSSMKEAQHPAIVSLRWVQSRILQVFERAVDFGLHTRLYHDKLSRKADLTYKILVPDLSPDEFMTKVAAMRDLALGLDIAVKAGFCWREQASMIWQKNLASQNIAEVKESLEAIGLDSDVHRWVPVPPLPDDMIPTAPGITPGVAPEDVVASIDLTPSAMSDIVTVNEARRDIGLGPVLDGEMTINEYRRRHGVAPPEEAKRKPSEASFTTRVTPSELQLLQAVRSSPELRDAVSKGKPMYRHLANSVQE